MPPVVKPLFRSRSPRPRLSAFTAPAVRCGGPDQARHWAKLLGSKQAEAMKETELLADFIADVFGDLLGYTGPAGATDRYTLKREATVEVDGKFADAVLGDFRPPATGRSSSSPSKARGRATRSTGPSPAASCRPSTRRYRYAINLPCDWISSPTCARPGSTTRAPTSTPTSGSTPAALAGDDAAFRRFVFLLGAERVVPAAGRCHLDELLADSRADRPRADEGVLPRYADLRQDAFEQLRRHNPAVPPADLLAATQKLLDRVLFIAFCEDRGLLPAETIARAYQHADPYNPRPIWDNFRGLFRAVNEGNAAAEHPALQRRPVRRRRAARPADRPRRGVPGASTSWPPTTTGRRPADDDDADAAAKLIDVDILGHIFEQSITDLEAAAQRSSTAGPSGRTEPQADAVEAQEGRGVLHAGLHHPLHRRPRPCGRCWPTASSALRPQHASRRPAAVRKRAGRPARLRPGGPDKPRRQTALVAFWEAWQDELATVRILDPACGSGAFLIEAFEQLYAAYQQAQRPPGGTARAPTLFDLDRQILQNNLYGVDLNDEAVEICRLSLWIKTAQRGKVLTSLDHTIRVGNSVVADPAVHPRAFDWQAAFPEVFAAGGFDVVVGNPPYVRQEWIAPIQAVSASSTTRPIDGMADLYVYFYELGLQPAEARRPARLHRHEQVDEGRLRRAAAPVLRRDRPGSSRSSTSATPSRSSRTPTCSRRILVARKPTADPAAGDGPRLRHPARAAADRRPVAADRGRRV